MPFLSKREETYVRCINKPVARELRPAIEAIDFITKNMRQADDESTIQDEWRYIAIIIDQMLLYVYSFSGKGSWIVWTITDEFSIPEKRWLEHFIISGVSIISVSILYKVVHQITTGKYAMQNMETIQLLVTGFSVLIKMTNTIWENCYLNYLLIVYIWLENKHALKILILV